jgi:hypothetical protein
MSTAKVAISIDDQLLKKSIFSLEKKYTQIEVTLFKRLLKKNN